MKVAAWQQLSPAYMQWSVTAVAGVATGLAGVEVALIRRKYNWARTPVLAEFDSGQFSSQELRIRDLRSGTTLTDIRRDRLRDVRRELCRLSYRPKLF